MMRNTYAADFCNRVAKGSLGAVIGHAFVFAD